MLIKSLIKFQILISCNIIAKFKQEDNRSSSLSQQVINIDEMGILGSYYDISKLFTLKNA